MKKQNATMQSDTSNDSLPAVALNSRWHEILGDKKRSMSDDVRRQRWEKWKSLGRRAGKRGKEMVKYWSEENVDETCYGCKHRDGDWCKLQELPCNVNPVLTFNEGIIGMACCGAGYEAKQLDISDMQS